MANRIFILLLAFFVVGCVPPYKPEQKIEKPTVVNAVSPRAAFAAYTLDTAKDFRILAQGCIDGKFEYVSELIDESIKLDTAAIEKRSKPLDAIFAAELGSDELDKEKAAKVLMKIADDLDPDHKVELVYPKVEPAPTPPEVVPPKAHPGPQLKTAVDPAPLKFEGPIIYLPPKEEKPAIKVTSATRLTGKELLAQCRNDVQKYDIEGNVYQHLYQHGFTPEQVNGLSRHQLFKLHDNVHAGVIDPRGVK